MKKNENQVTLFGEAKANKVKKAIKVSKAKKPANVKPLPSGVDTWMIGQTMPAPTVADGGSLRVFKPKAAPDEITAAKVKELKAAGAENIDVATDWIWFDIPARLTIAQKCDLKMIEGVKYSSKRGHHYINITGAANFGSNKSYGELMAKYNAVRV